MAKRSPTRRCRSSGRTRRLLPRGTRLHGAGHGPASVKQAGGGQRRLCQWQRGRRHGAAEAQAEPGDYYREVHACMVLAMAQHQLNKREEANAAFANGKEVADTALPKLRPNQETTTARYTPAWCWPWPSIS